MNLCKFSCFSAQMLIKGRLAGAQKGHGLLKKKADALQVRFRMILGKIIEVCFTIPLTQNEAKIPTHNHKLGLQLTDGYKLISICCVYSSEIILQWKQDKTQL